MCGIAGIINWSDLNKPYTDYLEDMCTAMNHRGPDDWGMAASKMIKNLDKTYEIRDESKGVFLGHKRLSILDLSAHGHQPMVRNDGDHIIVFNGEIYNYIELREKLKSQKNFESSTDTEVLLAAYQIWGEEMLDKLDGMFAFVIYDRQKRQIFAARDAIGIKPFYYSKNADEFVFASEPEAVLKGLNEQGRLDHSHASEFMIIGISDHDEGTFIKNVNQLQGGHFLRLNLDSGELQIREYWNGKKEIRKAQESDFDDYITTAKEAIKRQLRSDVPLGSSLSGGIDSSTIVSLAGELLGKEAKNYKALTFSFPNFEDDESELARLVAGNAGIEWHEVVPSMKSLATDLERMVTKMGEPFSTLSMFAQFKVMEKANHLGLKVMLDGQGGDELYLGYPRMAQRVFGDYFRQGKFGNAITEWIGLRDNLSIPLWRSLAMNVYFNSGKLATSRKKGIYGKYLNEELMEASRSEVIEDYYRPKPVMEKQLDELRYYCLPRLLRFADRNSMAFSVEQRVPHLSNLLLDFALGLPIERRVHRGWSKYIVRNSMKGRVPSEVLWSTTKKGFDIPQAFWVAQIQKQLSEWVSDTADDSLFRKETILKDLRNPNTQGSKYLWSVISTILFMHFLNIKA
jgi:asparagine synthase (glutamine-hydrolysing)